MGRRDELVELTRVRVLQFLREPEVVFWVFAFPVVLAAVLGFAFRKAEVQASRVGVPAAAAADPLAERLGGVEHLEVERIDDDAEAARRLRKGVIDAWITPGTPPKVRIDLNRPEAEIARLRVLRGLEEPPDPDAPPVVALDPVEEKGSRYVDFLFPGLLGMNIMGTGMWLIGFAIADLRQKKVLRRMLVTPMRKTSFLSSFLLARLVWFGLEVGLLVLFGALVLDVPFRCGLLSFAAFCLLGAFAFSGLGMLVCSRVKTIQGASGMLNLALVPMWLFSGVFFSYERFPEALHPVLRLLPLTGLNDGLRALMLDGQGPTDLLFELAALALWSVLSFAVALKVFRWE